MQNKYLIGAAAVSSAILAACGGSSGGSNGAVGAILLQTAAVPGISSSVVYSFDLGAVDPATSRYYVTDRTNKSIDTFDPKTGVVTQFANPGFAGCKAAPNGTFLPTCAGANNDASGPDGLDIVGNNLYVGDVNTLWIMDKNSGAVVKKISIPDPGSATATGLRADEGCFDPDDNLYAISTPGANNPFMTFIDTTTQAIIATVTMNDTAGAASAGLEACVYDKNTKRFYVNNDGSTANPNGEMDGIPAAAIVALKPGGPSTVVNYTTLPGVVSWALPALCDPTGIAKGPGNQIGAMCRPGTLGTVMVLAIMDTSTGKVVAQVPAGGGDQITYDSITNKWYLGNSRWTATGKSCGGGSATCPLTPSLGVVDGSSLALVAMVPSGNNSHSVASFNGRIYSPFTNPTATGGGAAFPNGGLNIYAAQ